MKGTVLMFILGLFAVGVSAATAHVSLHTRLIHTGYDIGVRLRETRALEEEGRRLRVELSLLRSPDRIEKVAREKLGMVTPAPDQIRVVKVGQQLASAAP